MYIIQEIQTDANGSVAMLPPVVKQTQNEAESEYHIKLGYAAISSVAVHAVAMFTEEGFPLLHGCYKHASAPENSAPENSAPSPEPSPLFFAISRAPFSALSGIRSPDAGRHAPPCWICHRRYRARRGSAPR